MEYWKTLIELAKLEQLETLVEEMANDDSITNEEYTTLYGMALARIQRG